MMTMMSPPAVAAQAALGQITFPPDLPAQAAYSGLSVRAHQELQGVLHGGAFRARSAGLHGLAHQAVVDVDIRPHHHLDV
jgi:hypothetical protein